MHQHFQWSLLELLPFPDLVRAGDVLVRSPSCAQGTGMAADASVGVGEGSIIPWKGEGDGTRRLLSCVATAKGRPSNPGRWRGT